jgi:hypothetical protein
MHQSHDKMDRGFLLSVTLLTILALPVHAGWGWGSSNSNSEGMDESAYGNSFTRSWLSNAKGLSFKVEGCAWANAADSEEVGCLQDESEDGTTNWYMMANCKRPQVVFSVFASDSSSSPSCNSGNFVGSVSDNFSLRLVWFCRLVGRFFISDLTSFRFLPYASLSLFLRFCSLLRLVESPSSSIIRNNMTRIAHLTTETTMMLTASTRSPTAKEATTTTITTTTTTDTVN